jgi:anti-sigma factor RsiW
VSGHVSAQRIERYHQGKLAPAELLTVGDHLATCAACRAQMGSADQLRKAFVALGTELETAADNEPAHLAPEQMAAYVDNQIDDVDRSIADSHLDHCAECHTELLDLRRLKTALGGYAAQETAPITVPARRNRLVALGLSRARWLPFAAAAALVLLFVWLGLMPLRGQLTRLNEQLGVLQRQNDALEEKVSTLSSAAQAQETHGDGLISDGPMVVVLNDGGTIVTLDKQGRLAGLKSDSQAYEQLVKTGLTEQRVKPAPLLAELIGKRGVIMGPASEGAGFRSPVRLAQS